MKATVETLRLKGEGLFGIGSRERFELQERPIPVIVIVFFSLEFKSRETIR